MKIFDNQSLQVNNHSPYGSCLLGSVNLTKFVEAPSPIKLDLIGRSTAKWWESSTRMLDNVVEINGLPFTNKGMKLKLSAGWNGYPRIGLYPTMLRMKYGSGSIRAFEQVNRNGH